METLFSRQGSDCGNLARASGAAERAHRSPCRDSVERAQLGQAQRKGRSGGIYRDAGRPGDPTGDWRLLSPAGLGGVARL